MRCCPFSCASIHRLIQRFPVGRIPKQVVVDLGYRGVDADNPAVEIVHRGRFKSMTNQQRRWLKRRHAIEPARAPEG
jgi:hypothetical protein